MNDCQHHWSSGVCLNCARPQPQGNVEPQCLGCGAPMLGGAWCRRCVARGVPDQRNTEPQNDARPGTAPGIYTMPDADYRADPALSCSEARRILDSPAKYRHDRDAHTEQHTAAFDFGKAAHTLILGAGVDVVVVDADDWRSKAAREERDEAHELGATPILARDWAVVVAMRDALRAHPLAAALIDPDRGRPEQSMFWTDARTGVPVRARLDWLPDPPTTGRLIIPDYKSAKDASTRAFGAAAWNFGYAMQAAHYLDGVATLLDLDQPPAFVFVCQDKEPPYLVNVVELDTDAMAIGRDRMRRALDVYVRCTASGEWPGYGDEVNAVGLPRWAQMQHDDDMVEWSADEDDTPW